MLPRVPLLELFGALVNLEGVLSQLKTRLILGLSLSLFLFKFFLLLADLLLQFKEFDALLLFWVDVGHVWVLYPPMLSQLNYLVRYHLAIHKNCLLKRVKPIILALP